MRIFILVLMILFFGQVSWAKDYDLGNIKNQINLSISSSQGIGKFDTTSMRDSFGRIKNLDYLNTAKDAVGEVKVAIARHVSSTTTVFTNSLGNIVSSMNRDFSSFERINYPVFRMMNPAISNTSVSSFGSGIVNRIADGINWIINKFTRADSVVKTDSLNNTMNNTVESGNNYRDNPFGFHSGITLTKDHHIISPEDPQGDPYKAEDPYVYAKDINVGWERPLVYAYIPARKTNITTDVAYSNVPESMEIFANIDVRSFSFREAPKMPEEIRELTVYAPAVSQLDLEDEKTYLQFVKDLVGQYNGDGIKDKPNLKNPIKYWQIDNELPGIPPEGAFSSSSKENDVWFNASLNNYAHILDASCMAIKSVDPQAKVAMSGMADIGPGTEGVFRAYYLKVLEASKDKCVDIFDYHFYGDAKNNWVNMKDVYGMIRTGLDSIGYKNMEIWITETGTYSGKPRDLQGYAPFQSEKEQAIDLMRRLVYPLTFGVKKVFWATGTVDFGISEGIDSHLGLIYNGKGEDNPGYGVKKLSFYTYKKLVEVLEGSDWNNIQTIQEKDGVYIYKFMKQGKPIWVAWADNKRDNSILISNVSSTEVEITEAVPNYEYGRYVTDYNSSFLSKTESVNQGRVSLLVGNVPVFIEER